MIQPGIGAMRLPPLVPALEKPMPEKIRRFSMQTSRSVSTRFLKIANLKDGFT